tara:strand:+ start:1268 stop:1543 length:276 start_codon:yes stop_codon:yes gene_type:complete
MNSQPLYSAYSWALSLYWAPVLPIPALFIMLLMTQGTQSPFPAIEFNHDPTSFFERYTRWHFGWISNLVVISVHYGAVDHESRRIRNQTIG